MKKATKKTKPVQYVVLMTITVVDGHPFTKTAIANYTRTAWDAVFGDRFKVRVNRVDKQ